MVEAEAWKNEPGGSTYTLYHLNRDFGFFIKAFYQIFVLIISDKTNSGLERLLKLSKNTPESTSDSIDYVFLV